MSIKNKLLIITAITSAMILVAMTGQRGFGLNGSNINKLIFVLYALGALAIFPALAWLILGLVNAL